MKVGRVFWVFVCCLVCAWSVVQAQNANTQLALRLTTGGALIEGQLVTGRTDQVVSLLSAQGRTRFLRCASRCVAVSSIPFKGTLVLGQNAQYRIVLGGNYRAGQKVSLTFRMQSGHVLQTTAKVGAKAK